jgi:CRISPR-associated protein Cas2
MMYWLSYDIENDKIRNKVAKLLQKMGMERIQYSVFIGPLSEAGLQELETKIVSLYTEKAADSIFLLPLHQDMIETVKEIGEHKLDWEYLKGEKKCLIF